MKKIPDCFAKINIEKLLTVSNFKRETILNFNLISDAIRFLGDTLTVVRHVPGENAVLIVKYEPPPSHCLPLEFTW